VTVAYSYIRFSSAEQKKGDSLRRQIELSEDYARRHNLTLDDTLHLQDLGMSAFNRSNITKGALGGFLKAVESGHIAEGSFLLVESLDRLSRDQVLYALEVFTSILRRGITIVTLADGMVYNKDSIAHNYGNLVISITIMARAHEESLIKSKRIKAAWDNKRSKIMERKLTAQCPRWMQLSADKTTFELIPERAALVKDMLKSAHAGMGQAQIAKRLNEQQVPNFSGQGKGWHSSYINKILTSPALHGEFQPHLFGGGKNLPHGDPISNYYPALICKEDFQVLQMARRQRLFGGGGKAKKGTTVSNLLSGLVKCGYCGKSMIIAGATAKRVQANDGLVTVRPSVKVLMCDGGRRGLGCFAVQWNYKDFETSFLTFCRGLDLAGLLQSADDNDSGQSELKDLRDELERTQATIQENNRRVQQLLAAIEGGEPPTILVERMRQLENEIATANDREKSLQDQLDLIEVSDSSRAAEIASVQDLLQKLDTKTGDELFVLRVALAEQIRRLVSEVRVHPAGTLTPQQDIEEIKRKLLDEGFSKKRVDAYIQTLQTEPKRQGRGVRGRYASRKDSSRYFVIKGRNGGIRVIYPKFENPSEVTVELNAARPTSVSQGAPAGSV
jgi:DNA invertase Pin-like site-specific DNA recombinase